MVYIKMPKFKYGFSKQDTRKFKIYINKGEREQIEKWVSLKRNIETGGDLFGLWIDHHTAVVQFVIGPGLACKRTTVSFHQDVEYLEKIGGHIIKTQGLCNIGQWHSHHQLSLNVPSAGDENTVWGNMPRLGLDRYIVLIANIWPGELSINCFLFETKDGKRLPVLKGSFVDLDGNSPLRLNKSLENAVKQGAENINEIEKTPSEIGKASREDHTSRRKPETNVVHPEPPSKTRQAANRKADSTSRSTKISDTNKNKDESQQKRITKERQHSEDNTSKRHNQEDRDENNKTLNSDVTSGPDTPSGTFGQRTNEYSHEKRTSTYDNMRNEPDEENIVKTTSQDNEEVINGGSEENKEKENKSVENSKYGGGCCDWCGCCCIIL